FADAGLRPLLELDDHRVWGVVAGLARKDEVDPFGGLRDTELDADADVVGNVLVPEHPGHRRQRCAPGLELGAGYVPADALDVGALDYVLDLVVVAVVQELRFGCLVNDHASLSPSARWMRNSELRVLPAVALGLVDRILVGVERQLFVGYRKRVYAQLVGELEQIKQHVEIGRAHV